MKSVLNRKLLKRRKARFSPLTVVVLVLLIVYTLFLLYLLFWAVMASFKINQYVFDYDTYGIPNYGWYKKLGELIKDSQGNPVLKAILASQSILNAEKEGSLLFYTYRNILSVFKEEIPSMFGKDARTVYMAEMYLNSFLYAGGCALVSTVVPCITAYCCARFDFKIGKLLHTIVIVVMIIPIVGSLPSEIQMANKLGIFNEIWGLWIMKANFLGLYFLVFFDIFKALPKGYTEAAKIDGASNLQVFLSIALPLIRNTFFTVFLVKFIEFWNDYQTPLVFMYSYPTVARGLNDLINAPINVPGTAFNPTHVPAQMATVVLTALPIFILFVIFQKRLLGNLTMGGIKG